MHSPSGVVLKHHRRDKPAADGEGSAFAVAVPGHRNTVEHEGIRRGLPVQARQTYESDQEVRGLVNR